jgi:hypothetical protein
VRTCTFDAVAQLVDQTVGWQRLPRAAGLGMLVGLRNILPKRNLYDTPTGQP